MFLATRSRPRPSCRPPPEASPCSSMTTATRFTRRPRHARVEGRHPGAACSGPGDGARSSRAALRAAYPLENGCGSAVRRTIVLPEGRCDAEERRATKYKLLRMEFTTFRRVFMAVPAQIISTGRRIVFRLLSWNPWQHVFFRLLDQLRTPLRPDAPVPIHP